MPRRLARKKIHSMQPQLADTLLAFGRILLGGLFVFGGMKHFFTVLVMIKRGVPFARLVSSPAHCFRSRSAPC